MKVFFFILVFVFGLHAESISPLPLANSLSSFEKTPIPFDIPSLKIVWKARIEAIHATGVLPLIDVESSFNPSKFDLIDYAQIMDDKGVALIALSPQIGDKAYAKEGKLWHDVPRTLISADASRYVPTSTSGIYPAWTSEPKSFINETIKQVTKQHYPLLGEFEFRHYLSTRQVKRNESYRDVSIPIDSEAGHVLFDFAEKTGISFQIHYEVEDALLNPLEKMLDTYPHANVIWCHFAQIRYSGNAKRFTPSFVRGLLERHPNLYFDLAFGDKDSVYKPSNEHQATIWDRNTGKLKSEWTQLIEDYPYHFLTAFDIGGDRHDELPKKIQNSREVLKSLTPKTQEIVAYKAFWKLVFKEDI
ncbi:MAG: hypothetical protein PHN18_05130 [Sulfurospirillaceae bacterium]|nr:hypothetical protein [Sulfurospirillaceae bacterium]MDD2825692.1 hypothetical protein [Sulfurospirillaceae bacterium]